jgi:ketosteroid isomerase-like protein
VLIPLSRDRDDFAATPHQFLAQGDVVVTFGVYTGTNKASDKALRAPFAHRWEVRDSKLARFDMFTDTLLFDRAMR